MTTTPANNSATRAETPEAAVAAQMLHLTNEKIAFIADRLRRMAAEIERDAGDPDPGSALVSAQKVQHTLMWGMANLNLDTLTSHAAAADLNYAEAKFAAQQGRDAQ